MFLAHVISKGETKWCVLTYSLLLSYAISTLGDNDDSPVAFADAMTNDNIYDHNKLSIYIICLHTLSQYHYMCLYSPTKNSTKGYYPDTYKPTTDVVPYTTLMTWPMSGQPPNSTLSGNLQQSYHNTKSLGVAIDHPYICMGELLISWLIAISGVFTFRLKRDIRHLYLTNVAILLAKFLCNRILPIHLTTI